MQLIERKAQKQRPYPEMNASSYYRLQARRMTQSFFGKDMDDTGGVKIL